MEAYKINKKNYQMGTRISIRARTKGSGRKKKNQNGKK